MPRFVMILLLSSPILSNDLITIKGVNVGMTVEEMVKVLEKRDFECEVLQDFRTNKSSNETIRRLEEDHLYKNKGTREKLTKDEINQLREDHFYLGQIDSRVHEVECNHKSKPSINGNVIYLHQGVEDYSYEVYYRYIEFYCETLDICFKTPKDVYDYLIKKYPDLNCTKKDSLQSYIETGQNINTKNINIDDWNTYDCFSSIGENLRISFTGKNPMKVQLSIFKHNYFTPTEKKIMEERKNRPINLD